LWTAVWAQCHLNNLSFSFEGYVAHGLAAEKRAGDAKNNRQSHNEERAPSRKKEKNTESVQSSSQHSRLGCCGSASGLSQSLQAQTIQQEDKDHGRKYLHGNISLKREICIPKEPFENAGERVGNRE